MMEGEDWNISSGATDYDYDDGECISSGDTHKLQFRKYISKARWNDEMGMAEVVDNKGGMWRTTGIVRGGKIYCSIEETLGEPPSIQEIEDLEGQCDSIPSKLCHVEHGRVSFFSINQVELPLLP